MLATIDNHLGSCHSFRLSKRPLQQKSLAYRNDASDCWWRPFGVAPIRKKPPKIQQAMKKVSIG